VPPLLETHEPDFIIHMGLAADRDYFSIERGAGRDGYHQIPDEDRKVVTRAETKRLWGKSPARLDSVIDIEDVLVRWQANARVSDGRGKDRGKGRGMAKEWDLKASDDVGNYVCGFVYYISLEWLWKKKKAAKVLFFHVPNLKSKEEFERGRDITVALIKAVVERFQY
jgi:pyroglutamyl-peptidase